MSSTSYAARTSTIMKAIHAEKDLKVHDPLMQILESYTMIVLPDQEFAEKLTWCLENCHSKFRDLSVAEGRAWYFQNDQDAMMFSMKWA